MTKKIIYEEQFLISGMMCHEGCARTIQHSLETAFKNAKDLPEDIQLNLDYQPMRFGIMRLEVIVESGKDLDEANRTIIRKSLSDLCRENLLFELIEEDAPPEDKKNWTDWINIAVNLLAILLIVILWFVFPPSLPLMLGLSALAFVTTAYTARKYLMAFFENLRHATFAAMPSAISLGWLLSLAHSLYHGITMPMAGSASMMFMSYLMPVILVTVVNGMDLLKSTLMRKSVKMQLQGLQRIFPQMAESYPCYDLSPKEEVLLSERIRFCKQGETFPEFRQENRETAVFAASLFQNKKTEMKKRVLLKENAVILVKSGQCFPVDGYLLQGNIMVNNAIETGKFQEFRQALDFVSAGAVNLGPDVAFYVQKTAHDSTINRMLLSANRPLEKPAPGEKQAAPGESISPKFTWLYTALIIAGIAAAIIVPLALGIFTVPLLLQNLTGILFSVCPCTLALAHALPKLFNVNQRYNKGIQIAENLIDTDITMDIIVFDKTGTLTTGNAEVESFSSDFSSGLQERIYLLEREYGRGHPLARAIVKHLEHREKSILIKDVEAVSIASRGLSAKVQGIPVDLGSADYLLEKNIALPPNFDNLVAAKTAQGCTAVCVAENGCFRGVIFIRHEARENSIAQLQQLHREGKKIIMLTGDSQASAEGFGKQFGNIFYRIEANQKPENKESYIASLLKDNKDKKVWFVGDGLNDILCARKVSESGGVSCAMNSGDPAAYFSDISLNGSLDYLFQHNRQNRFHEKMVKQNQGIMIYSSLIFIAFIIAFSVTGIALSPLIPMLVMMGTTGLVLYNTWRAKLSVDVALDKVPSLLKQALVSDFSLALLLLGSALLVAAILTATIASGGLALPVITFSAGIAMAFSSTFLLAAIGMLTTFVLVFSAQIFSAECVESAAKPVDQCYDPSIPTKPFYETVSAAARNLPDDIFVNQEQNQGETHVCPR